MAHLYRLRFWPAVERQELSKAATSTSFQAAFPALGKLFGHSAWTTGRRIRERPLRVEGERKTYNQEQHMRSESRKTSKQPERYLIGCPQTAALSLHCSTIARGSSLVFSAQQAPSVSTSRRDCASVAVSNNARYGQMLARYPSGPNRSLDLRISPVDESDLHI
jgi:hypothetical protein